MGEGEAVVGTVRSGGREVWGLSKESLRSNFLSNLEQRKYQMITLGVPVGSFIPQDIVQYRLQNPECGRVRQHQLRTVKNRKFAGKWMELEKIILSKVTQT